MFALFSFLFVLAVSTDVSLQRGGDFSSEYYYGAGVTDALDIQLNTCLSKLTTQAVDVIVDVAASINAAGVPQYLGSRPPMPSPVNREISSFLTALSQYIPQANFYSIILNGAAPSAQTKYYLSMANLASLQTTTTTVAPAPANRRGFYRPLYNMMWPIYSIQQVPATIGALTQKYLDARSTGTALQIPTSKPAGAVPTVFTVVITDGLQNTPITSYPSSDNTLIINYGGRLASTSLGYRSRNMLLPPANSASLCSFVRTARYQICQAIGGITA